MRTEPNRVAAIIDDDADIRSLLEFALRHGGFRTVSAVDGLDGVELVRTCHPSVTILDLSMPGIDGLETARRIREFSSTVIVIVSARLRAVEVKAAMEAGADACIGKPFRPRELRAQIEELLRRPRGSGQASVKP